MFKSEKCSVQLYETPYAEILLKVKFQWNQSASKVFQLVNNPTGLNIVVDISDWFKKSKCRTSL